MKIILDSGNRLKHEEHMFQLNLGKKTLQVQGEYEEYVFLVKHI